MLDGSIGQFFCRFTGSVAQTHCARRPRLVSKKFLEEEIFAETNFRELAFDRENRENLCLAKISRYTVYNSSYHHGNSCQNSQFTRNATFWPRVGKMGVGQMGVGEQIPVPLLYTRVVKGDCVWN